MSDAEKLLKAHKRAKKDRIILDYALIGDVKVDGIDHKDHPDYVDAFIASATYGDRDMTDEELGVLNDDHDFVYSEVEKRLY